MEQAFSHRKSNGSDTLSDGVIQFPESAVSLTDAYLRGLPSEATRTVYGRAIPGVRGLPSTATCSQSADVNVESHRAHMEALGRAPANRREDDGGTDRLLRLRRG